VHDVGQTSEQREENLSPTIMRLSGILGEIDAREGHQVDYRQLVDDHR
jgi:hypothetical protein